VNLGRRGALAPVARPRPLKTAMYGTDTRTPFEPTRRYPAGSEAPCDHAAARRRDRRLTEPCACRYDREPSLPEIGPAKGICRASRQSKFQLSKLEARRVARIAFATRYRFANQRRRISGRSSDDGASVALIGPRSHVSPGISVTPTKRWNAPAICSGRATTSSYRSTRMRAGGKGPKNRVRSRA
jgi:hypothetical protein